MNGIFLFSMIGERRRGSADRRVEPRGGRRCVDKVRLAVFAALCALLVPPENGPLPEY
jgi:hypothetical protein